MCNCVKSYRLAVAHHCLLPTAKPMAVPTEARQDSAACKRIEGDLSAGDSLPWLFEVGYGHLPPWQEVMRDEISMKLETGTVFSTFFILDSEGTISLKLKENDKSEHQIEIFRAARTERVVLMV